VVAAALLGVQPALADNDRDYVNFQTNTVQRGFNPQDYDISNMTARERATHHTQRRQQWQRKAERLARVAAEKFGPFASAKQQ